jgi:Ca2+-transporting ATPase
MAQKNVIVRKLPSVETLGSCNVICTDKTGTLTLNEMTVQSMVLVDSTNDALPSDESIASVKEYKVNGLSYSPMGSVEGLENIDSAVEDILLVSSLCNDAEVVTTKLSNSSVLNDVEATNKLDGYVFNRVGEPTEAALCTLVEKICRASQERNDSNKISTLPLSGGISIPPSQEEKIGSYHVSMLRSLYPRLATLEFSRDRKSMSVLSYSKETNKTRLLVKGAPNLLIERCSRIKLQNGEVIPINAKLRSEILEKVTNLASRPLRCIALAVREHEQLPISLQQIPTMIGDDDLCLKSGSNPYAINMREHALLKNSSNYEKIESDLTLVGIVGMMDPARPEVAEAIKKCKTAGIRVIMITGDAKDTAIAIARDVNIFPPVGDTLDEQPLLAFEGHEFFALPQDQQLKILGQFSSNVLFCRAQPSDKQQLVSILQSLGCIPAMTGDGVNDAPALQQAAIGISMGITGTEVSKSASDMIITNDDFSTIVSAVEEGRCIYANMQSFINFLISCNIGEVFCILFSTMLGVPEPLTAMHLLWVNLVTDGPPATSLGFNPPSDDLMTRKPRKSNEPLLSRWLMTRFW